MAGPPGGEMKSCCGIDCQICEAYIGTVTRNENLKRRVAKRWTELYQTRCRGEDVHCLGCRSLGKRGVYCEGFCRVQPCCVERGVETCAECSQFPCDKVREIFKNFPDARHRLEARRLLYSRKQARGRGV